MNGKLRTYATVLAATIGFHSSVLAEVHFPKTKIDAGKAKIAGELTVNFPFVVRGAEPIEFVELRSSCGCSVPTVQKRTYRPGERGVVEVDVHTASQSPGPRRFLISITVRDPVERNLVLSAEATLFREISVEPSNLRITTDGNGKVRQAIAIDDPRSQKLTILSATASSDRIAARVAPVEPGANRRVVEIAVDGDVPEGAHGETLVIRTDDPEYAEIVIPVTIVRPARVQAIPDAIRIGSETTGKAKRVMLLRDRSGETVDVQDLDAPFGVEYQIQPGQGFARISFTINSDSIPEGESAVRIKLARPIDVQLDVPIFKR